MMGQPAVDAIQELGPMKKHSLRSFTRMVQYCTCICLVIGGYVRCADSLRAMPERTEFRAVLSRFSVELPPKCSLFRFSFLKVADYSFPVRIYRWQSETDVFTISVGEGTNDLEYPEYTKLFLSDFRDQYVKNRQEQGGKIIEDHAWSFEGRPGWRIFEEHQGIRVELRVFVARYRFYAISVAIRAEQQSLNERQQKILESFHLLSQQELAAERERLIELYSPAPLPQQSPVKRLKSDAEEENLRGNVKRVYVEEAGYFGKRQPSSSHPVTRKDFDQNGYLVSRVEYADYVPLAIVAYGYLDGARVYRQNMKLSLPEVCDVNHRPLSALYRVQHKYSKTGALEEVRVSDQEDRVVELYSYETKQQRLQTSFSDKSRLEKDLRRRWKSLAELDADGNPVGEKRTEYYESSESSYVVVEKPVDIHGVVSGAIRGQVVPPPSGTVNRVPTVADVARNPNLTVKSVERLDSDSMQKANESSYAYTYEYDSYRNWTRRITFLVTKTGDSTKRVPIKVTYRTITYH